MEKENTFLAEGKKRRRNSKNIFGEGKYRFFAEEKINRAGKGGKKI